MEQLKVPKMEETPNTAIKCSHSESTPPSITTEENQNNYQEWEHTISFLGSYMELVLLNQN